MSATGLEAYLDLEEREPKRIHRGSWIRMIYHILSYPLILIPGVMLILVATSTTLLEPYLFGYAIDEAVIPKKWETLRIVVAIFFAVECIRLIAVVSQSYLFALLGQKIMQDLRMSLFSHFQCLPVHVFDQNPAGSLVTRVTNDVATVAEMFSAGFIAIIGNVLMVLGILCWLFYLHFKLALIATAVFPLLMLASVYFSKKLKISYREARSKLSALNTFLAENIMGMRIIHLFNRQKLHMERFARINQWYTDAQIKTIRVFAWFQPSITWAAGIAVALVILFGGEMAYLGQLKLGVLVACFSYVLALFQPVREIADKWNLFLSGMASAERIYSILDWPTEQEVKTAINPPKSIKPIQGHIVFENVWFAYTGEHWVLKNFSLEIKPGMKIGIVGYTGAGKTTLIQLLMRFYNPQQGHILLDGKDIEEYDLCSLRSAIGIVQQDVFLFSGSVSENITLWRDLPKINQSVFDEKEIQERGSNLSGGEKQILAFERTMASNPTVLILDEATASIDTASEQEIIKTITDNCADRTVITIAHRLSTIKAADLIVVLHCGGLVEQGNHEELLKLKGLYYNLYQYQSKLESINNTAPKPYT